jgi:hypothetical protein
LEDLLDRQVLRDLLDQPEDLKDSKDQLDPQELKDSKDQLDPQELKDQLDLDLQERKDSRDQRVLQEGLKDIKDFRDPQDHLEVLQDRQVRLDLKEKQEQLFIVFNIVVSSAISNH